MFEALLIIVRWRKFSHLEPSHTYLPPSPAQPRLSGASLASTHNSLSTLGLIGLHSTASEDRRKSSLLSSR